MTLYQCIETGCELYPEQCFHRGFAPTAGDNPPQACVVAAAHAGRSSLRGEGFSPSFFEHGDQALSDGRPMNPTSDLNKILRAKTCPGPSGIRDNLHRLMQRLNDRREWNRMKIAGWVRSKCGPVAVDRVPNPLS